MVLKRTPLLVRFHPLWWIRKKAAATAKDAKEAAKRAARDAKAAKRRGAQKPNGEAAATMAAAAAGVAAGMAQTGMAQMAGDDATAAGMADVGAAEEYLGVPDAGVSADGIPDVEVGEYMKRDSRGEEL